MHANTLQPETAAEIIAQVRVSDYERFLAIQLAPRDKRAALYALTAFYYEIAAIVDKVSEPMIGHIRLAWWREAVAEMASGLPPRHHPVTLALALLLAKASILADDLYVMLDARGAELENQVVADEAAWQDYAEGTVGVLHRAWARVLDEKAATDKAEDIRVQAHICALVSALRDIPRMAARGAVHLPPEPVAVSALTSLAPSEALNAMVVSVLAPLLANGNDGRLGGVLRPLDGVAAIHAYTAKKLLRARGNPYQVRLGKLGQVWAIVKLTDL